MPDMPTMLGAAGDLLERVHHRVERVRDVDHERVGADALQLVRHVGHDLQVGVEQVLARHARLARDAGGDDDDVGAGQVVVVRGAGDQGVVALDGRHLLHVERFALGQTFGRGDVQQHHIAQLLLSREQRQVAADLSGADESDLSSLHSVSPAPDCARFIA
jgi:hypothetical protein